MTRRSLTTLTALIAAAFAAPALAGTAKVTLGSETYSLDSVTCTGGPDGFSVQAKTTTGTQLLQLGAFSGEAKTVGFRVGDTLAQVADETGKFDGKTFTYKGEAQVFTESAINRRSLSITATCD